MKESIGVDIRSSREATIPPGKRAMIPTHYGCCIRLSPKSGLAWNIGLDILAGGIDPDFRGDKKVILQNYVEIPIEVHCGDTLAQGILKGARFPRFIESEPEDTERGTLGFVEADEPTITETKREEEPTILPVLAFTQQNDPALA
ncbi:uncharacterized protein [Ambystoma mexicanum]|uniref:uncharacterized protein n=1 Tax=Ambystoma mexicanum TaxID=8296 RepID=UPI0037E9B8C1